MNKILSLFLIIGCLLTTGCIKRDSLEDIDIYTTIYPIEYITERLYGEYSNINSIYRTMQQTPFLCGTGSTGSSRLESGLYPSQGRIP